jgi:hypothetical protein
LHCNSGMHTPFLMARQPMRNWSAVGMRCCDNWLASGSPRLVQGTFSGSPAAPKAGKRRERSFASNDNPCTHPCTYKIHTQRQHCWLAAERAAPNSLKPLALCEGCIPWQCQVGMQQEKLLTCCRKGANIEKSDFSRACTQPCGHADVGEGAVQV